MWNQRKIICSLIPYLKDVFGERWKKGDTDIEIKNATPLRKMLGVGTDWRVREESYVLEM